MKRILILTFTLILCLAFAAQAMARSYVFTDLGDLSQDYDTVPLAINNNGQIVGSSNDRAFLWENGQMTELPAGTAEWERSHIAYDINDQGQIVGVADVNGRSNAVMWERGQLTVIGNAQMNQGMASPRRSMRINNSGLVAWTETSLGGQLWQNGAGMELPVWGAAGVPVDLGGLNNNGQFAGSTDDYLFKQNGQQVELLIGNRWSSAVTAMNDVGQVVGAAVNPATGMMEAAVWNGSAPQFLGTIDTGLPWNPGSVALGINSNGEIVGKMDNSLDMFLHTMPAFLYDPETGQMIDLNTVELAGAAGMYLVGAVDINDKGQIIGVAKSDGDYRLHGFLLTPTPIPGAVWLLGTGLLGLMGLRRRGRVH